MTVYEIITDRIITALHEGCVPWKNPLKYGKPQNLLTKKPYRGMNTFLLASAPYASPFWLTFRQINEMGGSVRRNEHGWPVVFWKIENSQATEGTSEEATACETEIRRRGYSLLKYYRVFNVEQTEGIPYPQPQENTPNTDCEKLLRQTQAVVQKGAVPCYIPVTDTIVMPDMGYYENSDAYYGTLFHELTHWTGHSTRLGRSGIVEYASFGSNSYSQEELIAEMGSAFLQAEAGIASGQLDNSAAYINGWLKALNNDKRMVVHAASQAQKAADYIISCGS